MLHLAAAAVACDRLVHIVAPVGDPGLERRRLALKPGRVVIEQAHHTNGCRRQPARRCCDRNRRSRYRRHSRRTGHPARAAPDPENIFAHPLHAGLAQQRHVAVDLLGAHTIADRGDHPKRASFALARQLGQHRLSGRSSAAASTPAGSSAAPTRWAEKEHVSIPLCCCIFTHWWGACGRQFVAGSSTRVRCTIGIAGAICPRCCGDLTIISRLACAQRQPAVAYLALFSGHGGTFQRDPCAHHNRSTKRAAAGEPARNAGQRIRPANAAKCRAGFRQWQACRHTYDTCALG